MKVNELSPELQEFRRRYLVSVLEWMRAAITDFEIRFVSGGEDIELADFDAIFASSDADEEKV